MGDQRVDAGADQANHLGVGALPDSVDLCDHRLGLFGRGGAGGGVGQQANHAGEFGNIIAKRAARVAFRVALHRAFERLDSHTASLGRALDRRFDRSRKHFMEDYLPLADEWVLWDNSVPPHQRIADSSATTLEQLHAMLSLNRLQEAPQREMSELVRIGLEASRVATEKMLDYYKRMGIKVTPQMTLAPEKPKRDRRKAV